MPDEEDNQCNRCGSKAAVYQMYNLNMCRRCFREIASKMGFEKYE